MNTTQVNTNDDFFKAVKIVFDNWTAFQLAVTHSFAGSQTKESAEWFLNATYQWIIDNPDLEDDELSEFLFDTMNNEFNSILDDNSDIEIAKLLLNYHQMYRSGNLAGLRQQLALKFPSNSQQSAARSSLKVKQDQNEQSSSEDEEDDEEENTTNQMDLGDDENNNKSNNKLTKEDEDNFENLEEGWTLVTKSGKHLTK